MMIMGILPIKRGGERTIITPVSTKRPFEAWTLLRYFSTFLILDLAPSRSHRLIARP
jgi:hypothetical protein